jgi:ribulose-5-phosphate 4-epimerase/fuculose-1-phosphate aldolase
MLKVQDSTVQQKLKDGLIYLSRYAGLREDLVQAGGGNSSVKLDNHQMLIKASGFSLADVSTSSGYTIVDYPGVQAFFAHNPASSEEEGKKLIAECNQGTARPSIETFLHAITDKFTLHTHPAVVAALVCRKGGMEELARLFPGYLCVEYAAPGVALAKKYFEAFAKNGPANVVFMQNHGLLVSGKDADSVIAKTEEITLALEKHLNLDFSVYHNLTHLMDFFSTQGFDFGKLYLSSDEYIRCAANKGMWRYDFCPDCLVYCGKKALVLESLCDGLPVRSYVNDCGKPVIVWYVNNCYIFAESFLKAKEIESVLRFSAQVATARAGALQYLSGTEQNFLLNWEAEKYRRALKK